MDNTQISLSGISFPSLNMMYSQEEEDIISLPSTPSDATSSADEIDGIHNKAEQREDIINHAVQQNPFPGYHNDDECDDDGYPTDEHTIHSFAQPKERETKRRGILKLARNRLAKKKPNDEPPNDISDSPERVEDAVDDSSFLANVEATNVDNGPTDDSSFLVNAGVEDASTDDFQSIGNRGDNNTIDDSIYDIHASTLSRASEYSKASTIGDRILKDSMMAAAQMTARNDKGGSPPGDATDNQSASTYSYRRAYVDNVTLGSNFTSTCSALTDDYCFDARKTGMSVQPYEDGIKRSYAGPVDADTGRATMLHQSDINSHEESLARPPPSCLPNQLAREDLMAAYENDPAHLTRIVSFGEGGDGYVDEEAARRYAASERKNGGACCGWFTSSSRLVKLVVVCSIFLMLISVASVALALLLPTEDVSGASSARSSAVENNGTDEDNQEGPAGGDVNNISKQDSVPAMVPSNSPTPAPVNSFYTDAPSAPADTISPTDTLVLSTCNVGASCSEEGSRCTDGTTETCCGETFESFVCDCANVDGELQYMCLFTDACLAPSCETSEPSVSTKSPSEPPLSTNSPTSNIVTLSPSKAPESLIYATSALTSTPSDEPSTMVPTPGPSKRPTQLPTRKPSNQPTTPLPTTVRPTPIPTEFPIITTKAPSSMPIAPPSSNAPTTSLQTVTLRATKDTFLNATAPNYNYGTFRRIRVDGSPRVWSIIEFDTPSVINGIAQTQRQGQPSSQNEPRKMQAAVRVLQAKLRLYALDEGGGGIFYALPNAKQWPETSLTWNNMGQQVDRSGEFRVGSLNWVDSSTWIEIDVTDAFTGNLGSNSVQSFLIKSVSTNGVAFASRERGPGPELVLTFISGTYTGSNTPIFASPTPAPESPWPTYVPTRAETANPPTPRPTVKPTTYPPTPISMIPTTNPTATQTNKPSIALHPNRPSASPSNALTDQPVTSNPTNSPTPKPSRRPTTRAPYKRPLRPTDSPTASPWPTSAPTISDVVMTDPIVPPGCADTDDINLALKLAIMPQNNHNTYIVFPSQDAHVRRGIYSDENYGSSGTLILDFTSKALIEFDIGLIAVTSSIYNVLSVTLRLFVDSVVDSAGDTTSLSIFTHSVEWDEDQVTWNNFGSPLMSEVGSVFQVEPSNEGNWIDLDITDFIGLGSQVKKFVLGISASSSEGSRFVFASRKTCHSSKLVVVTEPI